MHTRAPVKPWESESAGRRRDTFTRYGVGSSYSTSKSPWDPAPIVKALNHEDSRALIFHKDAREYRTAEYALLN